MPSSLVPSYLSAIEADDYDKADEIAAEIARRPCRTWPDVVAKLEFLRHVMRPETAIAEDQPERTILLSLPEEMRALIS